MTRWFDFASSLRFKRPLKFKVNTNTALHIVDLIPQNLDRPIYGYRFFSESTRHICLSAQGTVITQVKSKSTADQPNAQIWESLAASLTGRGRAVNNSFEEKNTAGGRSSSRDSGSGRESLQKRLWNASRNKRR